MVTFYIVRHGAKEAVTLDPRLTDVGRRQALITGDYFKDKHIKRIISSPKLRTYETAQSIARHHKLEVEADERLLERMEWENGTFEDFVIEWNKTDKDREFVASNGMSSYEKGRVVRSVLDEIIALERHGNFVLVTHGGTIGDLLRNLFDHSKLNHVVHPTHNVEYIEISECSITQITYENGEFKLICVGDTSHLPSPVL